MAQEELHKKPVKKVFNGCWNLSLRVVQSEEQVEEKIKTNILCSMKFFFFRKVCRL